MPSARTYVFSVVRQSGVQLFSNQNAAPPSSVTLFGIYLDEQGNVLKTVRMHRNRLGAPVPRSRSVIEAEFGESSEVRHLIAFTQASERGLAK